MVVGSFPAQLYVVYFNIINFSPTSRYSWKVVHGPHWGEIVKVPTYGHVMFDRWIHVVVGFLLFVFFGFGRDATLMYRSWLSKCGEWQGLLVTRLSLFSSRAKTALSKTSSITESSSHSWYENTLLFLLLQDIFFICFI
jgi:pheromone a factor receptor